MKEENKSTLKMVILAIFFIVIILIYFNSLGNKSSEPRSEKAETEVEQLSNYDMVGNYPKTPRDVVKLHNRYLEMFYGEESVSDDELYILNQQVRNLYSSELLALNNENTNLQNLDNSIDKMKKEGYIYKTYELPEASQIIYYTQNGVEMATMEVTVTVDMEKEKSMGYLYIQYVLVKENEQWKILAWGETKMGQN
ncbi:MAG: hypothetical protein J6J16_06340 [Lachnospiraceae bacterium]|nr:hypothetical protein [Lachnospiraceae bacterium]